ncbi:hypothetical protein [Nonomuraea sp. NPDC049758]|uniref:hypothetical protein n=1 Tax=Nonomuraea sp. NPDC049758 TaxID=3154360 RepID=UPI003429AC43
MTPTPARRIRTALMTIVMFGIVVAFLSPLVQMTLSSLKSELDRVTSALPGPVILSDRPVRRLPRQVGVHEGRPLRIDGGGPGRGVAQGRTPGLVQPAAMGRVAAPRRGDRATAAGSATPAGEEPAVSDRRLGVSYTSGWREEARWENRSEYED